MVFYKVIISWPGVCTAIHLCPSAPARTRAAPGASRVRCCGLSMPVPHHFHFSQIQMLYVQQVTSSTHSAGSTDRFSIHYNLLHVLCLILPTNRDFFKALYEVWLPGFKNTISLRTSEFLQITCAGVWKNVANWSSTFGFQCLNFCSTLPVSLKITK